jgi:hypothetical protein
MKIKRMNNLSMFVINPVFLLLSSIFWYGYYIMNNISNYSSSTDINIAWSILWPFTIYRMVLWIFFLLWFNKEKLWKKNTGLYFIISVVFLVYYVSLFTEITIRYAAVAIWTAYVLTVLTDEKLTESNKPYFWIVWAWTALMVLLSIVAIVGIIYK